VTTTKLGLTETANGQANYLNVNEALARLDQLVQGAVTDRLATPPGSPTNGSLYIITATATGAWAGRENQLAYWLSSVNAWTYVTPREGMLLHVNDEDEYYKYTGSAWTILPSSVFTGGTLSTALNEAPIVTLASASTVNIGGAAANTISISGTTTITSFGTIASGAKRVLIFQGALTITHNATSLILPTGGNIITAAGDVAEFVSLGSGNWRCTDYTRADGTSLAGGTGFANPMTTAGDIIVGGTGGAATRLAAGTNGQVLKIVSGVPAYADNDATVTQSIIIACSDETTALSTGAAKVTFRMPFAFTLSAVRASLTTAQASGSIITIDIDEGGTSILSTKLTIDNTEKTSTTAASAAVISDANLADDAEITIDIDQIGDGTAAGLKVALIGVKV